MTLRAYARTEPCSMYNPAFACRRVRQIRLPRRTSRIEIRFALQIEQINGSLRLPRSSRFSVQAPGGVAEWLCSGLQSRGRRFDSDPRLSYIVKFTKLLCASCELVYRVAVMV